MTEKAEKTKRDKIAEKGTPQIGQLPFRLVDKQSNKTTKLIANSKKTETVDGQNRWFTFSFKRPVFIYRAVVNETNYPEYKNFEIKVEDDEGNFHETRSAPRSGKVFLNVNRFCKSISFKPPKAYFQSDKKINSIEVYGFDKSEVGKFIQFAREIEALKEDALKEIDQREAIYRSKIAQAEKAEAKAAEAEKELSRLKGQADRQRSSIRRLESERNDLTTKNEALGDSLKKNERDLDMVRSELDSKTKQQNQLDDQVNALQGKLTDLRANIDLFPSELESFVKQGSRNTTTLFWLALVPILIIAVMFGILISGAVDLTTKIDPEQNINLYALIASRTPYVVVALAIITACYQIARFFISELIQINRQRLSLTKVSIIAKDVSASAETGLDLSEIERYGLRVRLKMELLKDHLKGYISPNIDVKLPSRITNYLPFSNLIDERREKARKSVSKDESGIEAEQQSSANDDKSKSPAEELSEDEASKGNPPPSG